MMSTTYIPVESDDYQDKFLAYEKYCSEPFSPEEILDFAKANIVDVIVYMNADSPYNALEYLKHAYRTLERVQEILERLP